MRRATKIMCAVALSLSSVVSFGQMKAELPLFSELNYIGNTGWRSLNPTTLSDNPVGNMTRIDVGYSLGRGDFHDVDESSKTRALGASVTGYHRFGKVDCFGLLSYRNGKQNDRRWNSTMYISDANPFILADSIRSDFNIEEFDLRAGVSYTPIRQLSIGLNVRYLTGSSANQTDPRPKNDAMHFVMNPGIAHSGTFHARPFRRHRHFARKHHAFNHQHAGVLRIFPIQGNGRLCDNVHGCVGCISERL